MATDQLNGVNYEVDGKVITFFDVKGMKIGKNWAINSFFGAMVEIDPESIIDTVHTCIANDVKAGNSDKIAQLQLAPRQAVIFYLEGQLTSDNLKNAVEGPDFIDIPDVEIDGRTFTVRVLEEPKYKVATADAEGNVL